MCCHAWLDWFLLDVYTKFEKQYLEKNRLSQELCNFRSTQPLCKGHETYKGFALSTSLQPGAWPAFQPQHHPVTYYLCFIPSMYPDPISSNTESTFNQWFWKLCGQNSSWMNETNSHFSFSVLTVLPTCTQSRRISTLWCTHTCFSQFPAFFLWKGKF